MPSNPLPQTSRWGKRRRNSAASLQPRGSAQRFRNSYWTTGCSGASCSRTRRRRGLNPRRFRPTPASSFGAGR
eukprot:12317240-Alexandrium_andersonii.AAC.1